MQQRGALCSGRLCWRGACRASVREESDKECGLCRRYAPPEAFAPFVLQPGLCYSGALEAAASAMGVAAVAGVNCARLAAQHLGLAGRGAAAV